MLSPKRIGTQHFLLYFLHYFKVMNAAVDNIDSFFVADGHFSACGYAFDKIINCVAETCFRELAYKCGFLCHAGENALIRCK